MQRDSSPTHTGPLDSEEAEGVLVEAQDSSDEEVNILDDNDDGNDNNDDEQSGFGGDDDDDYFYSGGFEDDDEEGDEMNIGRIGLHDLNTLTHLYRFGLLNTANSKPLHRQLTDSTKSQKPNTLPQMS
jgi:hypothetical protein